MNKFFLSILLFVASVSPTFAKEISISQVQANWNPPTRTSYGFVISYPRSMKENPPVVDWKAEIPCGALVDADKSSIVWDQAASGDKPACSSFGVKDGVIVAHVKASNGEEYTCFYNKGSRTGLGETCATGRVELSAIPPALDVTVFPALIQS